MDGKGTVRGRRSAGENQGAETAVCDANGSHTISKGRGLLKCRERCTQQQTSLRIKRLITVQQYYHSPYVPSSTMSQIANLRLLTASIGAAVLIRDPTHTRNTIHHTQYTIYNTRFVINSEFLCILKLLV
jgi:hypothetical protein